MFPGETLRVTQSGGHWYSPGAYREDRFGPRTAAGTLSPTVVNLVTQAGRQVVMPVALRKVDLHASALNRSSAP
jgi:hypothetical protein